MKMLMLDKARGGDSGRSESRMGYSGSEYARQGYGGAEGAYGARNGMEMGYGKMSGDEMRRGIRSEMGGTEDAYGKMENHYPYVSPVYEEKERNKKNRIGFALEPSDHDRQYKQDAEYNGMDDEMRHKTSSSSMGHAKGHSTKLTKEMADEWMSSIQNEDGSRGPHWTMDQVKQIMAQKGWHADPLEAWVVLNAMYADYCKVFKKHGIGDKLDAYIDMAKAFIEDKDAVDGKVVAYFENIVMG